MPHTPRFLDGNEYDDVYVDFEKAFEKVDNEILIQKLQLFGISGKLLFWIKAFLLYRKQFVTVNGVPLLLNS